MATALFGAELFDTGVVTLDGQKIALTSPRKAALAGIAMLPGDRKTEGLSLMQSVRDNAFLSARAFSNMIGPPMKTAFGSSDDFDAALDAWTEPTCSTYYRCRDAARRTCHSLKVQNLGTSELTLCGVSCLCQMSCGCPYWEKPARAFGARWLFLALTL